MTTTPEILRRLQSLAGEFAAQGIQRLPPVPRLCAVLGCTPVTLGKAVRQLSAQGVLTVSTGRGTVINAALTGNKEGVGLIVRNEKSTTLAGLLIRDLHAGRISASPLPSAKELCSRYGVCHKTLRKALATLISQRFLQRRYRRHHSVDSSISEKKAGISLLLLGDRNRRVWNVSARTPEHFRLLEQECAQRGITLEVVPFKCLNDHNPQEYAQLFSDSAGGVNRLGFMIWNCGIGWDDSLIAFVRTAVQTGKPVTILDESGGECPQSIVRLPLPIISMAVLDTAGSDVARYLLSLGHTRIAFFHPMQSPFGRNNRLEGLKTVYAGAGLKDGVSGYSSPLIPVDVPFADERFWTSQRRRFIGSLFGSGADALMTFSKVRAEFIETLAVTSNRLVMEPTLLRWFDDALSQKDITAWVCYNDAIALDAMRFLFKKKIDIPQDISILSFDDSAVASDNRISSYNFGGAGVIRTMIHHILQGKTTIHPRLPQFTEPQGYITDRGSVRMIL